MMHSLFRIILGLLFNILFLNQSFAQDINQALADAYSSHPLLFAERASGRAVVENVTDALSGWRPEVSLNSSIGKNGMSKYCVMLVILILLRSIYFL